MHGPNGELILMSLMVIVIFGQVVYNLCGSFHYSIGVWSPRNVKQ
jgi:hypothetical protein